VHFVDDVDLAAAGGGQVLGVLADLAHGLDAVVGRAVDLDHVDARAGGDLLAARAGVAGAHFGIGDRELLAAENLGEDARDRGLADPTRSRKEVRLMNPIGSDRIGESPYDVGLADDVSELSGSPFSSQNHV